MDSRDVDRGFKTPCLYTFLLKPATIVYSLYTMMASPNYSATTPCPSVGRRLTPDGLIGSAFPARSSKRTEARGSVLLNAALVGTHEPGRWISYSRNRNWWANGSRYRGTAYTYTTVLSEVGELATAGLIEHDKRLPGSRNEWQSRFRANPDLLVAPPAVEWHSHELIRLKDSDGHLVDYRDTDRTLGMRKRLDGMNEALTATQIDLHHPSAVHDGQVIRIGEHVVYPAMNSLYRVFNRGSFTLGGRFYGGWWQQVPGDAREHLTINGGPVVELDYAQLHPRILYAIAGLQQPEADIYAVAGWERPIVKRGLLILINAGNHAQAVGAIALRVGGEGAHAKAACLI